MRAGDNGVTVSEISIPGNSLALPIHGVQYGITVKDSNALKLHILYMSKQTPVSWAKTKRGNIYLWLAFSWLSFYITIMFKIYIG